MQFKPSCGIPLNILAQRRRSPSLFPSADIQTRILHIYPFFPSFPRYRGWRACPLVSLFLLVPTRVSATESQIGKSRAVALAEDKHNRVGRGLATCSLQLTWYQFYSVFTMTCQMCESENDEKVLAVIRRERAHLRCRRHRSLPPSFLPIFQMEEPHFPAADKSGKWRKNAFISLYPLSLSISFTSLSLLIQPTSSFLMKQPFFPAGAIMANCRSHL